MPLMPNIPATPGQIMKWIIAVYCRVSSEDQADRGTIEIQKEFAAKYVNLYNLEVFDYYCDDGVSGTLPLEMRPEGKRLLEDAAKKRFNMVIFYKLDRIGRKVRVILNAVNDLDELGVTVKSMTEPFENETPTGKFLLTTLAGIAELDRDTILARMWSGAQLAAKQGRWLGGIVPYGYRKTGKRLVISDEPIPGCRISEEDVIEIIYKMAGKEKATCAEIADYLNSMKIPTKYQIDKINNNPSTASATIWHPSRVAHIIRSTTYKGIHQYGKKTSHKGSQMISRRVPAIVSDELWEAANEVLTSNKLFSKRNSQIEYLLRGMIRCGNCGYAYVGRPNKRDNTKFYVCIGKSKLNYKYYQKERCIGKSLRADWLDAVVWKKCLDILKNPEKIYKEKGQAANDIQPALNISYELQQIKIRLKAMSGEREKLLDLFRKEIITEQDLKKQIDKLYSEETNLNKKLSTLNDSLPKQELKRSKDSVVSLLKEFVKAIQTVNINELPFELKRSVVKMLIDKVIIYTEKSPDKSYPEVSININWRFDAAPFKIDYIENYTVKPSSSAG